MFEIAAVRSLTLARELFAKAAATLRASCHSRTAWIDPLATRGGTLLSSAPSRNASSAFSSATDGRVLRMSLKTRGGGLLSEEVCGHDSSQMSRRAVWSQDMALRASVDSAS